MGDLFLSCLKQLLRNPKRTALTALSIAVGVCSVVIISSLGSTGTQLIDKEMDKLGLEGAIVSPNTGLNSIRMQPQMCNAVANLSQVESAAGLSIETGVIRMHGLISNTIVWGLSPNYQDVMNISLLHGRFITPKDIENNAKVCLLDSSSAIDFYKRENIVGKKLSYEYEGERHLLEIIGIIEAGGSNLQNMVGEYIPSLLYIPSTVLETITGKSGYSQISLRMDENCNSEAVEIEIIDAIEHSSGYYDLFTIENLSTQNEKLGSLLDNISLTLSLIAGISLIVATIGTMTIMMISIKERTKEIGIKKAIGATNKNIMIEYLMSSIIITLIGTAAGNIIATIVLKLSDILLVGLSVDVKGIGISTIICILLGTVFGLIPAIQASKLDPIESLRTDV